MSFSLLIFSSQCNIVIIFYLFNHGFLSSLNIFLMATLNTVSIKSNSFIYLTGNLFCFFSSVYVLYFSVSLDIFAVLLENQIL